MFVDCMCQCPPLVSNLSMYYDTEMSTHGAISPPTDRAPSLAACIVAGLSLSICSTTESQFLSLPPLGDGLVLHLGLTLIWPAHVTLGDVGSAISELMLLLLVLKRGLTWPRVPDLAWWRFPASAVREGLHIGFGINVRCARDGKQTRSYISRESMITSPVLPFSAHSSVTGLEVARFLQRKRWLQ
ncbi:hypothetical protein MUK42_25148 [Musa troglodytarum]|uniref:Uncharacterized protein n=1 Tax=Musa troglodytarum TaxID=320322 RepID=A0A9E7IL57_9LILI|nr:hypothetical protein MUK42_25148 [Musa troglodytarum]